MTISTDRIKSVMIADLIFFCSASKSRLVGGLHYRSDCEVGLQVGNKIGQYAIDKAKLDGAN